MALDIKVRFLIRNWSALNGIPMVHMLLIIIILIFFAILLCDVKNFTDFAFIIENIIKYECEKTRPLTAVKQVHLVTCYNTEEYNFGLVYCLKMCHLCRTFLFVATLHLINIANSHFITMCSD